MSTQLRNIHAQIVENRQTGKGGKINILFYFISFEFGLKKQLALFILIII